MSKIFTKVVGSTFTKNGQSIISKLTSGQKLDLNRESSNQYDKNAIKILKDNEPIGYINAEAARSLAERMDGGEKFICLVEQVTGEETKYVGCNISLESTSIDNAIPSQEDHQQYDILDEI